MSLSLSRRVLEKISRVISHDHPAATLHYLLSKSIYSYSAGEWNERRIFNDPMMERQAEQGNAFDVITFLHLSSLACIECGCWDTYLDAQHVIEMISDRFDNNYGRWCPHFLTFRYHIKRRMAEEASEHISRFQKFSDASDIFGEVQPFWLHAFSSRVDLLRGDFESASIHLNRIPNAMVESSRGPFFNGFFQWAYAAIAVEKARLAAEGGRLDRRTRRECLFALHRNLKNARKFAPDRTEALKFMGSYWWHAGSRRRALSYWRRSIREGERIGAKVELAHTFTDAGKLLGELVPGTEWRKRGSELYVELGIAGD